MTNQRRLQCEPVTDSAGRVIGRARSSGPLTAADLAAVEQFRALLLIRKESASDSDSTENATPDE